MPNHVTNILTASPKVIEAITRFYTDEEKAARRKESAEIAVRYKERTGDDWPYAEQEAAEIEDRIVDFELLIPMPERVRQTAPGGSMAAYEDTSNWYGWSCQNWGTKWNGYETEVTPVNGDLCQLKFDTAWSHPAPVVDELSRRFPDEPIDVQWADEDLGSNVGTYTIKGGEVSNLFQPEYGDVSLDLAARIKYGKTYVELKQEWGED